MARKKQRLHTQKHLQLRQQWSRQLQGWQCGKTALLADDVHSFKDAFKQIGVPPAPIIHIAETFVGNLVEMRYPTINLAGHGRDAAQRIRQMIQQQVDFLARLGLVSLFTRRQRRCQMLLDAIVQAEIFNHAARIFQAIHQAFGKKFVITDLVLSRAKFVEENPQIIPPGGRLPLSFDELPEDQIDMAQLVGRRFRPPRDVSQTGEHFISGTLARVKSILICQGFANTAKRVGKRMDFRPPHRGHFTKRIEQPAHRRLDHHAPVINTQIAFINPAGGVEAVENVVGLRFGIRQRRFDLPIRLRPVHVMMLSQRFGNDLERVRS